jgi:hypothetical protein
MRKESLTLLNQLIEHATILDGKSKNEAIRGHNGEKAIGESWLLYHLKLLKESLKE